MPPKIKIVFLAANPKDTSSLRLGEEVREIEHRIELGSKRDSFELIPQQAVRTSDLQRILLKHKPQIVHFSGHGNPTEEIVLEDETGNSRAVGKDTLVKLFKILNKNLRVIVLNACYSKPQAEALQQVIDYTIGMNTEVGDKMAINFASAFYQALAFDEPVSTAFELAKLEVDLQRLEGSSIPELFIRADADVNKTLLH